MTFLDYIYFEPHAIDSCILYDILGLNSIHRKQVDTILETQLVPCDDNRVMSMSVYFFLPGLNSESCIYYLLFLPIKLSPRGPTSVRSPQEL